MTACLDEVLEKIMYCLNTFLYSFDQVLQLD